MTDNHTSLDAMLNEAGGNAEVDPAASGWEQEAPPEPVYDEPAVEETAVPMEESEVFTPPRPVTSPVNTNVETETASTIIRVLDALRNLETVQREVATQLIAQGRDLNNEADTVLAVMNAPKMLVTTIRSLLEARANEPVERAFYIMKLERSVARNMAILVSSFLESDRSSTTQHDHIELARALVSEVEDLSSDNIDHIEATESLFRAFEGSTENE
mgnify:CR=1 FL=1